MLLIVAGLLIRWPLRLPRRLRSAPVDLGAMARLLLIALTSGMPLAGALELAGSHAQVSSVVGVVLRRARMVGLAAALAEAPAPLRPLTIRLARAHTTGAPVADTVAAFIEEERTERRAAMLSRINRLPVTLVVPLALLILPGFVLLTLGPTVAGVITDLFGAVQ